MSILPSQKLGLQSGSMPPEISVTIDEFNKEFLKISLKDLRKQGLKVDEWCKYLEEYFFTPSTQRLNHFIMTQVNNLVPTDQKTKEEIVSTLSTFEKLKVEFHRELQKLEGVSPWREDNFLRTLTTLAAICAHLDHYSKMPFFLDPLLFCKEPVVYHLFSLVLERIAEITPLEDSRYFTLVDPLDEKEELMFFVKEKGGWRFCESLPKGKPALISLAPFRSALFDRSNKLVEVPSITVSFMLNYQDSETLMLYQQSHAHKKPLEPEALNFFVYATYCFEPLDEANSSNSIRFIGQVEKGKLTALQAPPKNTIPYDVSSAAIEKAAEFSIMSIEHLKDEAFDLFRKENTTKHHFSIVFPRTIEEQELALLEILRIVQEKPDENIALISFLAENRLLACSDEELEVACSQVRKEESISIHEEEAEISPAVAVQIMINQLESKFSIKDKEAPVSEKAIGPSPEDCVALKAQKNRCRGKFQRSRRHQKIKESGKFDKPNDPRPLSEQLKPKMQKELEQVLEGHGAGNKNHFNRLVYAVLKAKAEREMGEGAQFQRGSHPKIHFKRKHQGSWGITLVHSHGIDRNFGPAKYDQKRTILDILNQ